MPSLLDIGLGLANLVFQGIAEDGAEETPPPTLFPSPADTRRTFQLSPPYYELPSFSQQLSLPNGAQFDIEISPKTHPEVYAFVRAGLRHDPEMTDVGQTVDSTVQVVNQQVESPYGTLSADVSLSAIQTTSLTAT